MESFCSSIEVGETKNDLVGRAEGAGYDVRSTSNENSLLIVDVDAMGRFICEVTISADLVTSSKYVFND